jgi:hypothetical protein
MEKEIIFLGVETLRRTPFGSEKKMPNAHISEMRSNIRIKKCDRFEKLSDRLIYLLYPVFQSLVFEISNILYIAQWAYKMAGPSSSSSNLAMETFLTMSSVSWDPFSSKDWDKEKVSPECILRIQRYD